MSWKNSNNPAEEASNAACSEDTRRYKYKKEQIELSFA